MHLIDASPLSSVTFCSSLTHVILRSSQSAWRYLESPLIRRRRSLPAGQALRTGTLRMASSAERNRWLPPVNSSKRSSSRPHERFSWCSTISARIAASPSSNGCRTSGRYRGLHPAQLLARVEPGRTLRRKPETRHRHQSAHAHQSQTADRSITAHAGTPTSPGTRSRILQRSQAAAAWHQGRRILNAICRVWH